MVHHTTSYCVWMCTKIVWKSHKILNNSFYCMDEHQFILKAALHFFYILIKMCVPFLFNSEPIFRLGMVGNKIKSTITTKGKGKYRAWSSVFIINLWKKIDIIVKVANSNRISTMVLESLFSGWSLTRPLIFLSSSPDVWVWCNPNATVLGLGKVVLAYSTRLNW